MLVIDSYLLKNESFIEQLTHFPRLEEEMSNKRESIYESIISFLKACGTKGANPSELIQKQFALSRQQVSRYLSEMVAEGLITSQGMGRGRKYFYAKEKSPSLIAEKKLKYEELALKGEENLYLDEVASKINFLSENIRSIIHHGFTELVNNVIDHSAAANFSFKLWENKTNEINLEIVDDGIGIFRRNQIAFSCKDLFESIMETAKGRRTSQPHKHAGEGIFFTSRLFDYFRMRANGLEWLMESVNDDWSIAECQEKKGTNILLKIHKNSTKSPEEVFAKHTDEDFQFTKNALFIVEPLTINAQQEHVSRSEAKRLLIGAEKFKKIIIDFKNTKRIGQGFADEVFRVFQNSHPNLVIEPKNMNKAVEAMVKHILLRKN